jgi:hypothetical protein
MKPNSLVIPVVALLVLGLAGMSIAQGNQQLYLIEGFPTRLYPWKVSTSIVKVNEIRQELLPVVRLNDETEGSKFVLTDHERRVVVVASPNIAPTRLTVVSMDNPSATQSFDFSVQGSLLSAFMIDHPAGPTVALFSFGDGAPHLTGVGPIPNLAQSDLPWDALRSRRLEGWWSPADESDGNTSVQIKDGKFAATMPYNSVDLGVSVPKGFAAQPDGRFTLAASNDQLLVIDSSTERGNGSRASGRTFLAIYNKKTGNWSTEAFSGGGSSVRVFGSWVVVNEANVKGKRNDGPDKPRIIETEPESPGTSRRQKTLNPSDKQREQATVDSLFRNSGAQFVGTVHFYDANSGKRYRLDTLQGDTEVLLISGTTIYYRVNDTLFKAQIGTTNIENTQQILRNDRVQLVHWAFLSH